MWFLQTDTLLLLILLCSLFGVLSWIVREKYRYILRTLPIVSLCFLWYCSEKFAIFYAGYVLVTWGFVHLLRVCKKRRALCFGLLCLACCLPLCYIRIPSLPAFGVTFIGIAYNMLKAIDTLYYEYYTGEKAKFEIYLNYMLFLPVLTAGPVFRYRDFVRTWEKPVPLSAERLANSTGRIILGLFQKVVLVSLMMDLLQQVLSWSLSWYRSLIIPPISLFILFFDMAGYASIAIGLGAIMGITVPENFKNPFRSPSFTQFWRNWHVTVSDWIREHVFILFQKHKLNKWHGALISLAVMVIMGLWHGFTLVYLIDGIALGLILAVENLTGWGTVNKRKTPPLLYTLRCLLIMVLFALNSMIFTLSVQEIFDVFKGLFLWIGGGVG